MRIIDSKMLLKTPLNGVSWQLAKKENDKEFSNVGPSFGTCKAYMWDNFYEHVVRKPEIAINDLYIAYKPSIYDRFNVNDYIIRFDALQEKLKFIPTRIIRKLQDDTFVIKPKDPKWFLCVEMFSLFLATIRYANEADKRGYDNVIKDPEKLTNYLATLDQDFRVNWNNNNGHGKGIQYFYENTNS